MAFETLKRIFGGAAIPQPDPEEPGFYSYRRPLGSTLAAVPAAYAAIGLLSQTMAQLPRTVARLTDPLDDDWEPRGEHPVTELLRHPSQLVDPWLFWEWLFRCLFGGGNAYAWIRRRDGRPVELVPATCTGVRWVHEAAPVVEYDLTLWGQNWEIGGLGVNGSGGLGNRVRARAVDVVSLHGPGFNGMESPSPIMYAARRTLELMDQAVEQQETLLRGGGLRTAITTDVAVLKLTPEQLQQHRETLERTYEEARRKGTVPILGPGYGVASTGGMSAVDIQLIDLLKWSVEDIARVFNVPPRFLHHYHEGFRATAFEQQAVDFERWTLTGHVHRVQEQLTAKLLSAEEVSEDLVVRLPSDRIRAGSWSESVTAVELAVARGGVMTINEGRRRLRLPDREDGDRLLQPKGAPAQDGEPGEDS